MFGIGSTELIVILLVALVILGPKSLSQVAKTLGSLMGQFRRVSTEFQRTLNTEIEQDEHQKRKKEAEKELFGEKKSNKEQEKAAHPADTTPPAAHNDIETPEETQTVEGDISSPSAAISEEIAEKTTSSDNTVHSFSIPDTEAEAMEEAMETLPQAPEDSPLAKALAQAQAEAADDSAVPESPSDIEDLSPLRRAELLDIAGEEVSSLESAELITGAPLSENEKALLAESMVLPNETLTAPTMSDDNDAALATPSPQYTTETLVADSSTADTLADDAPFLTLSPAPNDLETEHDTLIASGSSATSEDMDSASKMPPTEERS